MSAMSMQHQYDHWRLPVFYSMNYLGHCITASSLLPGSSFFFSFDNAIEKPFFLSLSLFSSSSVLITLFSGGEIKPEEEVVKKMSEEIQKLKNVISEFEPEPNDPRVFFLILPFLSLSLSLGFSSFSLCLIH